MNVKNGSLLTSQELSFELDQAVEQYVAIFGECLAFTFANQLSAVQTMMSEHTQAMKAMISPAAFTDDFAASVLNTIASIDETPEPVVKDIYVTLNTAAKVTGRREGTLRYWADKGRVATDTNDAGKKTVHLAQVVAIHEATPLTRRKKRK